MDKTIKLLLRSACLAAGARGRHSQSAGPAAPGLGTRALPSLAGSDRSPGQPMLNGAGISQAWKAGAVQACESRPVSTRLQRATRRFRRTRGGGTRLRLDHNGYEHHHDERTREHKASTRRGEARRTREARRSEDDTHTHTRTHPNTPGSQDSQHSTPQEANKHPKHTYTPRARRVSYTALGETRNSVPKLFGVMFKEGQGNTPRLAQTWVE
jgi:hypothetical protein